jgi:ectoine hydroxylase-related dioxygenase (phytanoyl-CoA dioxygenase family)
MLIANPNIYSALKDQNLNKDFCHSGFIKLENMVKEELIDLTIISKKYINRNKTGFQYSLMENDFEKNCQFQNNVLKVLNHFLNEIFIDFKALSVCLLTKSNNTNYEMELHQDWSFTDERKFAPCTVWIPLDDTNEENGSLFILPKSQHYFENFRSQDYPTARFLSSNFEGKLQSVNLKKGDVVLFHPGVFHGSHPNTTNFDRSAISLTILPNCAPFVHVKMENEDFAKIFTIKENVFLSDLSKLNEVYLFESEQMKLIEYKHQKTTIEAIKAQIK